MQVLPSFHKALTFRWAASVYCHLLLKHHLVSYMLINVLFADIRASLPEDADPRNALNASHLWSAK